MNELEAWKYIQKFFSSYSLAQPAKGMCAVLNNMLWDKLISGDVFHEMDQKLRKSTKNYGWLYPCNAEGAIQRVAYCEERINELQKL